MNAVPYSAESVERFRTSFAALMAASERYHGDPGLRSQVEAGDVAGLVEELGVKVPEGVTAKIVANTPETYHVVLPADPNAALSEETLTALAAGGKTIGTAGTATGTAATISSMGTCAGTVSTTGTVGTAGSFL